MIRSIAICGFKGCGKDYAGKVIAGRFNHLPVAFADPIKNVITKTFHLSDVEEYDSFKRMDHDIMNRKVSGRRIVRETGMAMRGVNVNFATEYISTYSVPVVITDLRFDNELSFCKKHNMIIVKVQGGHSDGHISEQGIDSKHCDIVIENNFDSSFGETLIKQLERFIL